MGGRGCWTKGEGRRKRRISQALKPPRANSTHIVR